MTAYINIGLAIMFSAICIASMGLKRQPKNYVTPFSDIFNPLRPSPLSQLLILS